MTAPVVEVAGLRKEFGRAKAFVAVDSVDFTLHRASTLAIVGESGSGKTTLARCLVGLERPSAGAITICGRPRSHREASLRERRARAREIQMVFQDPYESLNPRVTVRDTLLTAYTLAGRPGGSRRGSAVVRELLDLVELPQQRADAYPRQLSGGQRQRVAIARALAADPQVLVLDEAVAALDVSVQAQILNLLADVRTARGVAYLFISHDLNVVRHVADDVLVMRHGQVVERGVTLDVLANPIHPYTQLLLDSVPRPGWTPGLART
ncbi:N/A [soil metagenome]